MEDFDKIRVFMNPIVDDNRCMYELADAGTIDYHVAYIREFF